MAQTRAEHDELTSKLHLMTKSRHEMETAMQDECGRNKEMSNVIRMKDELLDKRLEEIDEMDRKLNDVQTQMATLEA